jgi:hypothetical protein
MPGEDSKHATVILRDETCGPDKEFRVHILFDLERAFPELEQGYIMRLHRLEVHAYSIIFLHSAFKDHNTNRCRPNTSSYNTKTKLFNVPTKRLNHFLLINPRK